MTDTSEATQDRNWVDSSGLSYLLRVFTLAVHPAKLALGLGGIIFTICWGGILDKLWTATDAGITPGEIAAYVARADVVEPGGGDAVGVFHVFAAYQVACIRDAIESVRYGRLIGPVRAGEPTEAPGDDTGGHAVRGAFANLMLMGSGVVWMFRQHPFFALLFVPVALLIWSLFGGAVCRIAAVQFARDDTITSKQAVQFAWGKLFSGFFMAPVFPLGICLVIGLMLIAGGVFLSIPWVGDVIGGLLFFLALLGGTLIALLLVGTVAGGSLFWPSVAVEGSDGFDAVQRSLSYVFGRPLRATWYAFWLVVMGAFGWLLMMFIVWLAAASTHLFVGIGSGLFGGLPDAPDKLTRLWDVPTFENLHQIAGPLRSVEVVGAGLVAVWVMLLWGTAWSFLASFYFSGSTVAYLLLRRDVDGTDLSDISYQEEEDDTMSLTSPAPAPAPADRPADAAPAAATGLVSLGVSDVASPDSGGDAPTDAQQTTPPSDPPEDADKKPPETPASDG